MWLAHIYCCPARANTIPYLYRPELGPNSTFRSLLKEHPQRSWRPDALQVACGGCRWLRPGRAWLRADYCLSSATPSLTGLHPPSDTTCLTQSSLRPRPTISLLMTTHMQPRSNMVPSRRAQQEEQILCYHAYFASLAVANTLVHLSR